MHNWLHDVSQYIFLNDSPQPADMIFIPGSRHAEPTEHAASLWQQKYAPLLLPSGRWSSGLDSFPGQISGRRNYTGVFSSECDFMCHILRAAGIPSSAILREDRATFTYQNAICSRYITESAGISVRRAILCCMPVHARRAYMYYQALFPETTFFVCPAPGASPNQANWMDAPDSIDLVLGELSRCGSQFRDIVKETAETAGGHSSFPSPLERKYLPYGIHKGHLQQ